MDSDLFQYKKNVHSQAGQDGILEKIFTTIGIKNGHFVEFGAWDGKYLSNSRKLYEEGWSGVYIEADKKKYLELQQNYAADPRIRCVNEMVLPSGEGSLDRIMAKYGLPETIDFLSIDIDSSDFEVFESIERCLPKVACIEGGKGAHPFDPRMPENCIYNIGQSLSVFRDVAERKGYKILLAFQDVIMVKKEYAHLFQVTDDLYKLYIDGYLSQEYTHISMFAERLSLFGRRNRILDYILRETNFSKYPDEKTWAREEEKNITRVLQTLPESLRSQTTTTFERFLAWAMGLFVHAFWPWLKAWKSRRVL